MKREIKTANILLTGSHLNLKIGYFVLSKYIWEDIMDQRRVRGACPVPEHTPNCGSPLYAAPEIFQRSDDDCSEQEIRRDYDSKVDIYSLGIILFEMCSDFGSGSEKIKEVTPLRKESKCPDGFKQSNEVAASMIEKLIHKDPEERPTAAHILNDELFGPATDATSVNPGAGDATVAKGLALSGDTVDSESTPLLEMFGLKMKD
jgi:translation initiation factor 2-alpha kinase 4